MSQSTIRPSSLTAVRTPVLVGAGVTLATWVAIGLPLGVVAAMRQPTLLEVLSATMSLLPGLVGAHVGARRAARVLDDRLSRTVLGVAGASLPISVAGLLVLTGVDESSVALTVVIPFVGALVGGWTGGRDRA